VVLNLAAVFLIVVAVWLAVHNLVSWTMTMLPSPLSWGNWPIAGPATG
jgi:hypothetical protein